MSQFSLFGEAQTLAVSLVMAIEEGCVRFSCGCGLGSCLVLGVQSRLVGVISGGSLIFDGQSLCVRFFSFERIRRR